MESSAEVMASLLSGTVEETCLWVFCVVSDLSVDINVLAGGRCATGLLLFSRCEIKTDGARREHRVLEFALSPCARAPRGT